MVKQCILHNTPRKYDFFRILKPCLKEIVFAWTFETLVGFFHFEIFKIFGKKASFQINRFGIDFQSWSRLIFLFHFKPMLHRASTKENQVAQPTCFAAGLSKTWTNCSKKAQRSAKPHLIFLRWSSMHHSLGSFVRQSIIIFIFINHFVSFSPHFLVISTGCRVATVSKMAVWKWIHVYYMVSPGSHQLRQHRTREAIPLLVSNNWIIQYEIPLYDAGRRASKHMHAHKMRICEYDNNNCK